jgi:O-acetyl-ADP-ribose deacetylase (regulator of RNase III)
LQQASERRKKYLWEKLFDYMTLCPMMDVRTGNVANFEGALVHCVSSDMHMGAGVARAICLARIYNQPPDWHLPGRCKVPNPDLMNTVVVRTDPLNPANIVFNLVSKMSYFHGGSYPAMRQVLRALRDHIIHANVHRVAMPRIGCGRDRLAWKNIEPIIKETLFGLPLEIDIVDLE